MKKILVIGAISYCILLWLFFSGCKTESAYNNHPDFVKTKDGWNMHVENPIITDVRPYHCTDSCNWEKY